MTTTTEWVTAGFFNPYDTVKDSVSGWTGKIVAQHVYANGCVRYEIAGSDKDGKPESYVFDREQIELINQAAPTNAPRQTGGPRSSTPPARR